MTEQWRPIPGYEGSYEVSDLGRIRSLDRVVLDSTGRRRAIAGKHMMRDNCSGNGYPRVPLSRPGSGRKFMPVHVAVIRAFVGARPPGMLTRHLNGDKSDCRLANLTYGTPSENNLDKVAHGTDHNARKTHCPSGHEYAGANLIVNKSGKRDCRTCRRKYMSEYMPKWLAAKRAAEQQPA